MIAVKRRRVLERIERVRDVDELLLILTQDVVELETQLRFDRRAPTTMSAVPRVRTSVGLLRRHRRCWRRNAISCRDPKPTEQVECAFRGAELVERQIDERRRLNFNLSNAGAELNHEFIPLAQRRDVVREDVERRNAERIFQLSDALDERIDRHRLARH